MEIYITRNGKQFGPYSIPDAQNMVRSGNLHLTDHAWHEGLTHWVPLGQISGFSAAPPAPPTPTPVATSSPHHPFSSAPQPKQSIFKQIGTGIVGIAVIALKYGFFLLKSLKTSLSMFLMIWVYSWLFGWPFAIGLVFLILIHEMGHVVAAKMLGLPVSLPMFIPMFGAYTTLKENPQDAWTAALFATGGPLAGSICSWICLLLGLHFHADWLIAIASVSFVFNIFNMIPVPPLDGGTMCAAISTWFWFLGLLLLGMALIYFHSLFTSIIIILIVFMATIPMLRQTFFEEPTEEMRQYYSTHFSNRLIMAIVYLSILASLVVGYGHASSYLTSVLPDNNI